MEMIWLRKEAVRKSERPKSREETPVVGYGNPEVQTEFRILNVPVFAPCRNATTPDAGL
jgi:hypothetical protein